MRQIITATLAFLCAGLLCSAIAQPGTATDREQVLKTEEEFRQAKLKNDTRALEQSPGAAIPRSHDMLTLSRP